MKRISIERYTDNTVLQYGHGCAGLIEGETDEGKRWILFLDGKGAPFLFWPKRDEEGGVVGPPMDLSDKDDLGPIYGTKEHPLTYSEWVSLPNTGLGSTDET